MASAKDITRSDQDMIMTAQDITMFDQDIMMTQPNNMRHTQGNKKVALCNDVCLLYLRSSTEMRPQAALRCGWNRRPIHWTSEKLSALSDVIYTVSHG